MSDRVIGTVTLLAAVGASLMAVLLVAFSTFVMRALGRMPADQGMARMQTINVAILNPLFGLVFFGTTAASLFLLVTAVLTSDRPGVWLRVAGAVLFLVGTIVVTMAFNVPLNNALARVDPASADGWRFWEHYQSAWTAWNHIRAVAATGAAIVLAVGFWALVQTSTAGSG